MIIKIRVLKINKEKLDSLYSNTLVLSDGVEFDYSKVKDVLRLLYPKSNIVEFSVM